MVLMEIGKLGLLRAQLQMSCAIANRTNGLHAWCLMLHHYNPAHLEQIVCANTATGVTRICGAKFQAPS